LSVEFRPQRLALGVVSNPLQFFLSGGAVAGHGYAGGAVVPMLPKTIVTMLNAFQVMLNSGRIPVVYGSFAVPAFKYRLGCQAELFVRVCRKFLLEWRLKIS